jgi:hypothetical protein
MSTRPAGIALSLLEARCAYAAAGGFESEPVHSSTSRRKFCYRDNVNATESHVVLVCHKQDTFRPLFDICKQSVITGLPKSIPNTPSEI